MAGGKMFLGKQQVAGPRGRGRPRRRRFVRPKVNRYTLRLPVNRQLKSAFPPTLHNVMNWTSNLLEVGTPVALGFTVKEFNPNHLFDVGGLGSKPYYWDEVSAIYEVYRVTSFTATIIWEETVDMVTATNSRLFVGLCPNTYINPSNSTEIESRPRIFRTKIIPRNTGVAQLKVSSTISKMQDQRQSVIFTDNAFHGDTNGSGPSVTPKFFVGAYSLDESDTPNWKYRVMIHANTIWSRMKSV